MNKSKGNKHRLGERLVAEFSEFRDALQNGHAIQKRYTVRTVELDLTPRQFDPEAVRVIRLALGVSQAVFAHLINVSVDLVAAWEQGNRTPDGPASRLLEMIETDKKPWLQRLERAASRKIASA